MTFLAPLAGLLAGGLGLAALLALHALKLRRRPVRISSTLLWRNATRDLEVNTPWRRPRATWMLLLQILAIALLALGIARPVLGSGGSITGRVVVVIDASASMNAVDERGVSRFDRAVDAVRERLNRLRRSDASPEIAIVRAAHTPMMVLAPTRSLGDALGALDTVTPTDQPLDPDALRDLLGSLRETGEDDEADNTLTVWAFTDAGSLRAADLPGVAGEIVTVGSDAPNAGIAAATGSRDPEDPARARVFVRLVSNADRPVGVVVRVASPDETVRTPVEIPAANEDAPGAITRTIAVDAPGAARVEITLEREDALAADNTAWVDLPDPAPPRTVVYAPEGRADPFLLD
ncbi:MAG: VWA domain-containing protein, partial [Planctomycetota bacterium]